MAGRTYRRRFLLLGGVCLLLLLGSMLVGRYGLSVDKLLHMLWTRLTGGAADWSVSDEKVVFAIRLPRIAAAVLVGAALAVSGTAYQGMFRNPMVSPDILGASTGAGFGAALAILLGPNGAGKSTLFRCMLGFLPHYQGSISLCGRDVRHLPRRELAHLAAYIPQSSQPLFDYTVRDTVLMGAAGGLEPLRQPGRQQLETAQRMMELVGIAPLADRGIRRISGGERQLALIARALAQQARILLMDEPAANLDYGNQFRLLQQVRRLTEQGYTVLLSTHDPEHALRFATHVLALHGGTVAACGPVEEMLTEELLHTLYRIPLTVAQVPVTGATVRSCVYDPAKP